MLARDVMVAQWKPHGGVPQGTNGALLVALRLFAVLPRALWRACEARQERKDAVTWSTVTGPAAQMPGMLLGLAMTFAPHRPIITRVLSHVSLVTLTPYFYDTNTGQPVPPIVMRAPGRCWYTLSHVEFEAIASRACNSRGYMYMYYLCLSSFESYTSNTCIKGVLKARLLPARLSKC